MAMVRRINWVSCIVSVLVFHGWVNSQEISKPAEVAAPASEVQATEAAAAPTAEELRLREALGTPRATFDTFVLAMEEERTQDAIACLDLSGVHKEAIATKGDSATYKLKYLLDVLENEGDIDEESIPNDTEGVLLSYSIAEHIYDANGMPLSGSDLKDIQRIELVRGPEQLWRFSTATVDVVDDLFERWEERTNIAAEKPRLFSAVWLRSLFPEGLRKTRFLLADYQWICLVFLIVFGTLADMLVRWLLFHMSHRWLNPVVDDERSEREVWKPVGLLVEALIWYGGTKIIDLPVVALQILLVGLKLFTVVTAIWTAFRMIDLIARYLGRRAAATESGFDDLLVPLVSKSLKAITVLVGLLIFAEVFSLPLTGLLGGLGLGGAALALASKDAISNFFGSFTVLVDRPFDIGDWVITEGIEGTVERVGFRSTRIRTFYNSLITLPNSRLTLAVVDNMGRRRFRRVRTMLRLRTDTVPEKIDAFCEGVRELIRRHPQTRKDYFHVYLNELNESSADVLLYCFLRCPDWSSELQGRHELLLAILQLARYLKVSFAYPTRTLNFSTGPGENDDENGPLPPAKDDPQVIDDPQVMGQRAAVQVWQDRKA